MRFLKYLFISLIIIGIFIGILACFYFDNLRCTYPNLLTKGALKAKHNFNLSALSVLACFFLLIFSTRKNKIMWLIGSIRSIFKYIVLLALICSPIALQYIYTHPIGYLYYGQLTQKYYYQIFACIILFVFCVLFCFMSRALTKQYAKKFKHPDYFNPTKKYENAIFNFYFGIDYKTGNILFVDKYRYQAVLIEWNSWKRFYGCAAGVTFEFWDMEKNDFTIPMITTSRILVNLNRVLEIKHKITQTSRGEWAKHVPEPMIKE